MKKHYHLIGIGGIGMSALARILLARGDSVSGSDLFDSSTLKALKNDGAKITIGHRKGNLKSPDVVVYSSGIPKGNIELETAKKKGYSLLHRSELLSQILAGYAPLLVSGTHGKTTTVSLLAHALIEANLDPCYAIGGFLNGPNSNGRFGRGVYFAVEADESDGSFLNYPSFGAIITNIEHDHMDFWKDEEALLKGFDQFASHVGSTEHLFWCGDDPLVKSLKLGGYSFGFSEDADLVINNFHQIQWKMSFDITFEGKTYKNIDLPLIGAHNVLNAAAVFGMGLKLDIHEQTLRHALKSFPGVGRRIEKKGTVSEIEIYDDYAHHPTEIYSTLRALKRALPKNRIILAFQPHRYTRTKYCINDFADAFQCADEVVLTDIYGAGEKPLPEMTPEKIIQRIIAGGYKSIRFVHRETLPTFLSDYLRPRDVLITMGAGDITNVGPIVLERLKQ